MTNSLIGPKSSLICSPEGVVVVTNLPKVPAVEAGALLGAAPSLLNTDDLLVAAELPPNTDAVVLLTAPPNTDEAELTAVPAPNTDDVELTAVPAPNTDGAVVLDAAALPKADAQPNTEGAELVAVD